MELPAAERGEGQAHVQRWRAAGLGLVAIGMAGCGGAAAEPGADTRSAPLAASGADAGQPPAAAPGVALLAPGSCDALLATLQADLFVRTRQRAEQAREWPYSLSPDTYPGGIARDTAPTPLPEGAAPGGEAPDAPAFERGDIVKIDGDRAYLLDLESAAGQLVALRASPGQPLGLLGRVAIEGTPIELSSSDGRVLVISRIDTLPQVYEGFPDHDPAFTKLTVVDFDTEADTGASTGTNAGTGTTAGATPRIERELYIEGDLVLARMQGGVARVVIQHVPKLRLDVPLISRTDILGRSRPQAQIDAQIDTWVQITDASVLSSGLNAYLPGVYEAQGGLLVARAPSCESTFVPEPGRADPGALSIFSVDLGASELATSAPDIEAAARASATPGGLPLASVTVFGYPNGIAIDPGAAIIHQSESVAGPGEAPRSESHLHVFELDGMDARYAAAGRIAGYVTTIDRQPGLLRVLGGSSLYVEDRFFGHEQRALTLAVEGERLTELGSMVIETANNGLDAAHFVGDHAYLFTSNVVGPGFGPATSALVALDLSDPAAPREMGRLPLPPSGSAPGPVPVDRLVTVGGVTHADEISSHSELWAFDIGGAGAPTVGASYVWPTASRPSSDPRALSFSPDRARVGVPVTGSFTSSFDILDLSASGITRLASIVPDSTEPTLVQCLELHGLPTDPESIAALEADPPRLAIELLQCNLDWPRLYVRRGLVRAHDAIVLSHSYRESRWMAASYSLAAPDAAPLSQIEF